MEPTGKFRGDFIDLLKLQNFNEGIQKTEDTAWFEKSGKTTCVA